MGKKFYDIHGAAQYLMISPRTMQQYAVTGKIKGFKLARKWRFMESDLEAFIEEQRRKAGK